MPSRLGARVRRSRNVRGGGNIRVSCRRGSRIHHDSVRAGERHHESDRHGYSRKARPKAWNHTATAGVHDREHPSFQLPGACHRDDERRGAAASERMRQLQQMACVVPCAGAGRQHEIVTGQLTLDTKSPRDPPHAWVGPIGGAGKCSEGLGQAVTPTDVSELVQHNGPTAIVVPCIGDGRKQDGRRSHAEDHRHRVLPAPQQTHGMLHAQAAPALVEHLPPFVVNDLRCLHGEASYGQLLRRQKSQEHEGSPRVEHDESRWP